MTPPEEIMQAFAAYLAADNPDRENLSRRCVADLFEEYGHNEMASTLRSQNILLWITGPDHVEPQEKRFASALDRIRYAEGFYNGRPDWIEPGDEGYPKIWDDRNAALNAMGLLTEGEGAEEEEDDGD